MLIIFLRKAQFCDVENEQKINSWIQIRIIHKIYLIFFVPYGLFFPKMLCNFFAIFGNPARSQKQEEHM